MSDNMQLFNDKRIVSRLDALIYILLDKSNLEKLTMLDKINILTALEFSNSEIARILCTSIESIESQKYRKRGSRKK
jgi:hypothetical protein